VLVWLSCSSSSCKSERGRRITAELPALAASAGPSAPPLPVRVEEVPVPGDLPAFVVRGREHGRKMLFLPGMCVHPGGYIEAFEHTAAARGDLVTLQGDRSCGGDGFARMWSPDLASMERRIEGAFVAARVGGARDVIVIGYSQGAERAERLVARYPDRYAAAILIASPTPPEPRDLAGLAAVVTMAGTLDVQASMRAAVPRLNRAGIASEFVALPGARHGQMGEHPEDTMAEALDFVERSIVSKMEREALSHDAGAER
jgi:pimeloyl-ACP methyl ester carboxylesterase